MCRITGFWEQKNNTTYDQYGILKNMCNTLTAGGPDDAGVFVDQTQVVALGHRRLAILDLSPRGHQPMISASGRYVITYNGEIYNFQEVKNELVKLGHHFYSVSDTEVLLQSLEQWGINCLKKFRGMWAFVVWDTIEKKLILCRDRIGVKPLYWYFHDGLFLFASELKAFHKHPRFKKLININALALYFRYGYIPSPFSIFENTHKLQPGSLLILTLDGTITIEKYWDIKDYFSPNAQCAIREQDESEIMNELEELFIESFRLRLVADVPVGVFLSGGIDSTLLTLLLQKNTSSRIKTFTIGFHDTDYNEALWAKKIANHLGTEHTEHYCTEKDALNIIPLLQDIFDEPFADSSAIPTYLVAKIAQQSVKVALSADGGDEQFFGYTQYKAFAKMNTILRQPYVHLLLTTLTKWMSPDMAQKIYSLLNPLLPRYNNLLEKYQKLHASVQSQTQLERYDIMLRYFLDNEIKKLSPTSTFHLLNNITSDQDILSFMMLRDLQQYLPDDILVKIDRASMANALETREPLLDHHLLEYTSRLSLNYKYRNGVSKYILKKILHNYLPIHLYDRPKQGFGIPLARWLQTELSDLMNYYFSQQQLTKSIFLNLTYAQKLRDDFTAGKTGNASKIWLILMYQMWHEKWMR